MKPKTTSYKKISSIDIYTSMPSRMKTAQNLEDRYLDNAPKKKHEKIKRVLQIYKDNKNVLSHIAERVLMALYRPRAFGHVGNKRKTKRIRRTISTMSL